jgi:dipeptidyl aminopeptidase/acylaminoacyl peptidase
LPSIDAAWRRRLRAPRVFLPRWAEDAPDRLIYQSTETGKNELHAWDMRLDRRRRVTDRPQGTASGRIEPGGERIWWFDDQAGSEFGRWMVQPFAGGPARPAAPDLADHYASGLALGRQIALIGVSGEGGSAIHLVVPGGAARRLYAHEQDAWVSGLSRDGRFFSMGHSEHEDVRHPAARVMDMGGDSVAELWDGVGLGVHPGPWSPLEGDQRLVLHHERLGSNRPALWEPFAGRLSELQLDLPGEVWATWYPDARALLLHHSHRGRSVLFRYNLSTHRVSALGPESRSGTVREAAVRPDGEVWQDWSDGATPPAIRSGDATVLLQPPGEPAPGGAPYQDITAGEVPGFLAEPEGRRPHPTVFLIHGGPEAHDADAFSPRVQAWVDHGFAVALVNYRGSTGYGRAWRDGMQGNPGLTEVEDVTALRDHLVASGVADPARIVLAGRSWGGYITLLGAGVRPDKWSLAIADVPVADYVAAFEEEMEPLKAYDRALMGGSPDERPDFYSERSPISYAAQVTAPVMILAGHNDPRCPIGQIRRYVARMAQLGHPAELYEFEAGHASLRVDEQIRQIEAQLAFASRHLGTPEPQ